MAKAISVEEVVKHTSPESCWVILYGHVYDVTSFLPSHPGGSKIILQLSGRDATEDYDPIHPPGTLEEQLAPEAKLGPVDEDSLRRAQEQERVSRAGDNPQQRKTTKTGTKTTKGGNGKDYDDDDNAPPPPLESLLNLDEIEAAATKRLSRRAWAYYFSAADDLVSKRYNSAVYRRILLRPRVFVDCTRCDTSTSLFGDAGMPLGLPVFVAPAAMARLGHADGEAGIARACGALGALQLISNNASMTPEQVVAGARPGQLFGWQLYVQADRARSEGMLARLARLNEALRAAHPADPPRVAFVCLTLDAPWPGKRELDEKQSFASPGTVTAAGNAGHHQGGGGGGGGGGGVGQQLFFGTAADLTWATTLPWLRRHTDLPIVLKGVQTHEDVALAARHAPQVKAVLLSNHGGRALDTAPPAVHTLLEVRKYCPEVLRDGRVELWVDGGVRRGTDVVKALCLGAKAVGIGRPALFGLGAGGQKGVERVLEILKAEVETCMRLLGAEKLSDLGPHFVNSRMVERDIYDGDAGLDKQSNYGLWAKSKI